MEIVDFLRTRLTEDERLAWLADTPTRWKAERGEFGPKVVTGVTGGEWSRECTPEVWRCDDPQDGCMSDAAVWMAEGQHIARHDPARVLADVAAKRAIIAEYVAAVGWYSQPENTRHDAGEVTGLWTAVQLLAQAYDGHPDFDPAWRVT